MNKRITIVLFLFSAIMLTGFIQIKSPVKKVYAYKQASIPGIIPSNDENDIKEKNGTKKTEYKINYNYWFYLSLQKAENIIVTGLWISGKQYDIKSEIIKDLPVKKIIFTGSANNDTTIMMPVTNNKVILVYPSGEKPGNSKYVLKAATTNELVIRYTWKGRTYYTTVKKIKELTPDVRV